MTSVAPSIKLLGSCLNHVSSELLYALTGNPMGTNCGVPSALRYPSSDAAGCDNRLPIGALCLPQSLVSKVLYTLD